MNFDGYSRSVGSKDGINIANDAYQNSVADCEDGNNSADSDKKAGGNSGDAEGNRHGVLFMMGVKITVMVVGMRKTISAKLGNHL